MRKVAQKVAQQLLQRALYVRNEYEFKLGWKYCLLEPMDIVTLTDAGLGLNKTPVRITEIEEDGEGVLSVKAEDCPAGVYTVSEYPTQPSSGYSADYNVSPGNAHVPVIFEAPLQLTGGEPQIWLATAGGGMWGRRSVGIGGRRQLHPRRRGQPQGAFRRADRRFARRRGFRPHKYVGRGNFGGAADGRHGAGQPRFADIVLRRRRISGIRRRRTEGRGTLHIGQPDARRVRLRRQRTRGGQPVCAHRRSIVQIRRAAQLDWRARFGSNWFRTTFSAAAFRIWRKCQAYSYTIEGAPLGQIQNLRLTSSWAYGKEAVIAWDKLDGADTYDVEIYAGGSRRRLRAVDGIVDNSYTYTQADMKADGGQVRGIVFKVRGRAVTGKTGNWAQIAAQNPQLQALQGISIDSGLRQAFFTCQKPAEEDFAGIIVWVCENAACPGRTQTKPMTARKRL